MKKEHLDCSEISKKLDLLIAILLANSGLKRKDVAKILGTSEKTIERAFAGQFNKIQKKNQNKET